jgi:hypothetical protein
MTVTQLNPPLPLETPRGHGLAHFMIDYGPELHLMWTVFIDATGECWTFQNPDIRAAKNYSLGRMATTAINPARTSDPVHGASLDTVAAFAKSKSLNGTRS